MADELSAFMELELILVEDGIYTFNDNGRVGFIKRYQCDSEHYQVTFENLTREQVLVMFETE